MCNFKIGQEVVCVKPHSQGVLKLGKVYPILGIRKEKCKCAGVVVDIGMVNTNDPLTIGRPTRCQICHEYDGTEQLIWWLDHDRFAPLQTDSEEADMNEAINEVSQRELFKI